MPEQERPDLEEIKRKLEERRPVLNPMQTAMSVDEDWFDAGTSDSAKAKIIPLLQGLPKKGWAARYVPLPYLGTMIGVRSVHTGKSLDVMWRLPEGKYHDPKAPEKPSETVRKEREQRVGRWFKGLIYTHDTYSTDNLIFELLIKLIGLGEGCISYSVDYDKWPDPPFGWIGRGKGKIAKEPRANASKQDKEKFQRWRNERARSLPFHLENIHPCVLFFDPFNSIPFDYIREEQIKRDEALRIVPELAQRQQTGDADSCIRITYVSPYWIGQWIDGEPIPAKGAVGGVRANKSGLPLHRMAFGGFGSANKTGDFITKGQGIIRQGRDLVVMKIVLLNVIARIQGLAAFQPLGAKGGTKAERARVLNEMGYEPGALVDMGTDISIEPFPEIKAPTQIWQQNDLIDSLLAKVFGDALMYGQRAAGETLGGQQNRYSIATAVYEAAQQAGQQLIAAVLMDLLHLVKYELEEQVPVFAGGDGTIVSIGPEDIDDGGMCIVNFSPPTEEEKAFKAEGTRKDLQMGIITPQEAAEEMGYENPEAHVRSVRVQKGIDMILGSNTYLQALVSAAMAKMGIQPPMPEQPVGAPPVEATPSGQAVTSNGASPGGNPEQQAAMEAAYAAPRM